jgi:hypothetical protein
VTVEKILALKAAVTFTSATFTAIDACAFCSVDPFPPNLALFTALGVEKLE